MHDPMNVKLVQRYVCDTVQKEECSDFRSGRLRWAAYVTRKELIISWNVSVSQISLETKAYTRIRTIVGIDVVDWTKLPHDWGQWWTLVNAVNQPRKHFQSVSNSQT